MTKAEAGRKGGLAGSRESKVKAGQIGGLNGDGEAKAARMREGRKQRIADLEAALAEARAAKDRCHAGWGETLEVAARLKQERDEARRVAGELLVRPTWLDVIESYQTRYPWLKENRDG